MQLLKIVEIIKIYHLDLKKRKPQFVIYHNKWIKMKLAFEKLVN
jgi:hypothetical protein